MKRLAIALVVIGLLTVSQVTHAANLEEGWYVKLGGVALFGFDPATMSEFAADWNFTSPLGQSGPFSVTQPAPTWPQRLVVVEETASGIAPGTGVDLWGAPLLSLPKTGYLTYLSFACDTTYDATQMRLSVLIGHTDGTEDTIWEQSRSGSNHGAPSIYLGNHTMLSSDTFLFRVAAVPEPTSFLAVLMPCVIGIWRRRRSL